jgi:hypothetical protein
MSSLMLAAPLTDPKTGVCFVAQAEVRSSKSSMAKIAAPPAETQVTGSSTAFFAAFPTRFQLTG